ncbi:MAG: DUF4097 family beta strand repeat protein [Gemmatimonadaceae bacterium]|nr:DUF4097 family beta strand repeat protein [Gemmatimonadaceae bacterium]
MRITVLGSLLACLCGASMLQAQVRQEHGAALDSTGAIRVYSLAGQVTVEAWNRDSIHIVAIVPRGARLQAGGTRSAFKLNTYEGMPETIPVVHLHVKVPRRAEVWVKTSSAPIAVRGLKGTVDLYTIEGAIEATGNPDALRIETMRGEVAVSGTPKWLRVRSGSGDVRFAGEALDLALSTVSGRITTPAGTGRGRVESVSGDVTITGLPGRGAPLEVDSHSGSVRLRVTARPDASFVVFSARGAISNALSSASPRTSGQSGAELQFTSGSGAARITIRTFTGGVWLNAAPPARDPRNR